MKKITFTLLLLAAFQTISFAQSADIEGVWKMYETDFDGEAQEVSVPMTLLNDGKIVLGGREEGTWALNESESTLTIQSDLLMNLEGVCTVTFEKGELHLTNPEKETSKLRRLSVQKDLEYNNIIVGMWELKKVDGKAMGEGRSLILDYNKNGVFYQDGIILGTWKYDENATTMEQKAERSGMAEMDGEASIVQVDLEQLIYDLNGARISFQKVKK